MDVYLGPQLPKERDAVGLFPRVSFRSCLQAKAKHETGGEGDLTGKERFGKRGKGNFDFKLTQ